MTNLTLVPQESLSDSPAFSAWLVYLGKDGRELLDNVVAQFVSFGEGERILRAIFEACQEKPAQQVTLGDIQGKNGSAVTRLRKVLNQTTDRGPSECNYGSISHELIPVLLEGKLPKEASFKKAAEVLSLWPETRGGEIQEEFMDFDVQSDWPSLEGVTRIANIPEVVVSDIESCISKLSADLVAASDWKARCEVSRAARRMLIPMLKPLLGRFISKLPNADGDPWSLHLRGLTLLTWAQVLVGAYGSNVPRVFFKEVRALHPSLPFSGGRIDALEIVRLNGKELTTREMQAMSKLAEQRYSSVGDLLWYVHKYFGAELEVLVNDWKCAVGDFFGLEDYITVDHCPLPRHVEQMERYLTFIPRDPQMMDKVRSSTTFHGRLAYFLPGHPMTERDVFLQDADDVIRRFGGKLLRAKTMSKHRVVTNDVINHAYKIVKNGRNRPGVHIRVKNQTELPVSGDRRNQMDSLFDSVRIYLDRYNIIELRSLPKGKVRKVLHFSQLEKEIEAGNVVCGQWTNRSLQVSCLNPDHKDSNPSMHVALDRGFFHCYSCGLNGDLEVAGVVYPRQVHWRVPAGEIESIVIPDQTHKLFRKVQNLLSYFYPSSPAEQYLEERLIDPRLAFAHEAGYGQAEILTTLLEDYDYELDELAQHGLIAYAARVPSTSVIDLLKRLGFPWKDIERFEHDNKQKKDVRKLPYFPLEDRVTFPLLLEGRITNFYGRATKKQRDKKFNHRKLSVRPGGNVVPQGGFNMKALEGEGKVLFTEAPLDALVLMQMSHDAVAQVGTYNHYVLGALLRSSKEVGLAFDRDVWGRKASQKIKDTFVERGFNKFEDFTEKFFADKNTEAKDFNDWIREQLEMGAAAD